MTFTERNSNPYCSLLCKFAVCGKTRRKKKKKIFVLFTLKDLDMKLWKILEIINFSYYSSIKDDISPSCTRNTVDMDVPFCSHPLKLSRLCSVFVAHGDPELNPPFEIGGRLQ